MPTVYLNASTGNDSNTYVQAQNPATPWLTVSKVVSTAVSGDTVSIVAGTYTITAHSITAKSLSWIGPAVTDGHPTVIFDGGGIGNVCSFTWSTTGRTYAFQNIKFQNFKTGAGVGFFVPSFDPNTTPSTLTLTNCEFKSIVIDCNGSGDGASIIATAAANTAYDPTIAVTSCLWNNVKKYSSSAGIVGGLLCAGRNMLITFTNCVAWTDATGSDLMSNVIFRNTTNGNYTVTMKNTIVQSSGANITWKTGTLTTETETYSCFNGVTSSPAGTGNITSAPLFIDPANSDFRLRPTSPCIDTGTLT